jgi:hypothetical protein
VGLAIPWGDGGPPSQEVARKNLSRRSLRLRPLAPPTWTTTLKTFRAEHTAFGSRPYQSWICRSRARSKHSLDDTPPIYAPICFPPPHCLQLCTFSSKLFFKCCVLAWLGPWGSGRMLCGLFSISVTFKCYFSTGLGTSGRGRPVETFLYF